MGGGGGGGRREKRGGICFACPAGFSPFCDFLFPPGPSPTVDPPLKRF